MALWRKMYKNMFRRSDQDGAGTPGEFPRAVFEGILALEAELLMTWPFSADTWGHLSGQESPLFCMCPKGRMRINERRCCQIDHRSIKMGFLMVAHHLCKFIAGAFQALFKMISFYPEQLHQVGIILDSTDDKWQRWEGWGCRAHWRMPPWQV